MLGCDGNWSLSSIIVLLRETWDVISGIELLVFAEEVRSRWDWMVIVIV